MFYRLRQPYMLRGWKGMPWVLVKRPRNQMLTLSREQFEVLLLCDGKTEVTPALVDASMQKTLHKCEEDGWIETCQEPQLLEEDQYYSFFRNRCVNSVLWSITGKCNYRCRHCYMDAPEGALGELSTEQALDLIDQMHACGVLKVDLTGGEPLVRRDFWQLIDRILSYGMTIGMVYTNGWLLNASVLDGFESRGIKPEISISFDGVGWHDWMRGVPGAEEAALRALKLCRERGFPANVEMCIHKGNQDYIARTVAALGAVGVTKIKAANVKMTDLWRRNSEGNALSTSEYMGAVIRYIPQFYEAGCPADFMLGGAVMLRRDGSYEILAERYKNKETSQDVYLCGAIRWSCYITPEGRLLPCIAMTSSPREVQEQFPLVQEIGLQKGLDDSFYMKFVNRRVKDLLAVNQECADCEYRLTCGGGCRANALECDHNLMGCDREACLFLKGGYAERVRQTADQARAAYENRKKAAGASKQQPE